MKLMCYRQHGATLLVSLIFLVLMTLFALTAFNMGKTSLQAVGNMQQRNQTLTAAQEAINDAISSTNFIDKPDTPLKNGTTNVMAVDINDDGTADVDVNVKKPTCIKPQVLKNAALLKDAKPKEEDLSCTQMQSQSHGIAGSSSGDSLCAEPLFEIEATAKDKMSDVTITVTQGVAVRTMASEIDVICK